MYLRLKIKTKSFGICELRDTKLKGMFFLTHENILAEMWTGVIVTSSRLMSLF